jgi:hypothetical protein
MHPCVARPSFRSQGLNGGSGVLEEQIVEAIKTELERQAADKPSDLSINAAFNGFRVNGTIDLEALAMAVAGSVAGGP